MNNIKELKATPHWSYSAFQTFLTCPLKYQFRYIDKVDPERTGSCFPFGRAFHAALSERARIGQDMSVREVKDVFEDFLKAELEATPNVVFKENESLDSMLIQGSNMLEAVCENWTDDFSVKSVAESFSVTVPGLTKPLIGEFDCIVEDGKDICIVDWKTSASNPSLSGSVKFPFAFKAIFSASSETMSLTPSPQRISMQRKSQLLQRLQAQNI